MKNVYTVLAFLLVLAVVLTAPAQADSSWGDDRDQPGVGDGGDIDDNDHPWGGDYVIGGGSEGGLKGYDITVVTGFTIVDVFIFSIVNDLYLVESTTTVKVRQISALSKPSRQATVKSGGKSFISLRKGR